VLSAPPRQAQRLLSMAEGYGVQSGKRGHTACTGRDEARADADDRPVTSDDEPDPQGAGGAGDLAGAARGDGDRGLGSAAGIVPVSTVSAPFLARRH